MDRRGRADRDCPRHAISGRNVAERPGLRGHCNGRQCAVLGSSDSREQVDPLAGEAKQRPHDNVAVIDPTKYFCQEVTCPAVIGGVVV